MSLTGGYDAVVEVPVGLVNLLLARVHQRGADPALSPSFLHDLSLKVGDVSQNGAPSGVLGRAEVQLSTPKVMLADDSPTAVVVRYEVRARYWPNTGTKALPEFIAGTVDATFEIAQVDWSGVNALQATVSDDDSKIVFTPQPGLSLPVTDIAHEIRRVLRQRFEPVQHALPAAVTSLQFKGLTGPDGKQAFALPAMLPGGTAPDPGLDDVTELFVKNQFAVAISKDYVNALLQPLKKGLLVPVTFQVKLPLFVFTLTLVTYTITVSDVTFDWLAGKISLKVSGAAIASGGLKFIAPNFSFNITQGLLLKLDAKTQTLSLSADGDPAIGGVPGFATDLVKANIIAQRDAALASAQPAINSALKGADGFTALLQSLDGSAEARYVSVTIEPDGLVLQGTVSLEPMLEPIVTFKETTAGDGFTAFTAFGTWVPGGMVEKYSWNWWDTSLPIPLKFMSVDPDKQATDHPEEHTDRFVLIAGQLPSAAQVCLTVTGTQVDSISGDKPVEGEKLLTDDTCKAGMKNPFAGLEGGVTTVFPTGPGDRIWLKHGFSPFWIPDPPTTDRNPFLDNNIAFHFDPWAFPARKQEQINTLVVFPGDDAELQAVMSMRIALRQRRSLGAAVAIVIVCPRMFLSGRGEAIAPALASFRSDHAGMPLVVTEDYESNWTRGFEVGETPNMILVDANGQRAWDHVGPIDAGTLTEALDRHLVPCAGSTFRLMRLAVKEGLPARDFLFSYAGKQQMALRRLRGHNVLINFSLVWSAPCIAELQRLAQVHRRQADKGLIVLAINNDEYPDRAAELLRKLDLPFPIVADPRRLIAERYGVHCWPTTVSLNKRSIVTGIQFGRAHGHLKPGPERASSRPSAL